MTVLHFAKWHGTGNDFILVDDRAGHFPSHDLQLVRGLCDRHLGIGSDGLILLQRPQAEGTSYHMEFFNPDGSKSFCGNGSRCAFAFWSVLEKSTGKAVFTAIDGVHSAEWVGVEVAVTLPDIDTVDKGIDGPDVDFIHTGSPHELVWVKDVDTVDITVEGPQRRYAASRAPDGTNVNFVQVRDGAVIIRTYERGVEAETLSCGSGVVAAALSAMVRSVANAPVVVHARGGVLRVEAERQGSDGFDGIRLTGPVRHVFNGMVHI